MSDLTDFLLARIAEDEAVAREALESGGGDWWTPLEVMPKVGGNVYDLPDADHIARWSPAHVLAECAAKRRIVAKYAATAPPTHRAENDFDRGMRTAMTFALLDLAAVYSEHPDYRDEWRA